MEASTRLGNGSLWPRSEGARTGFPVQRSNSERQEMECMGVRDLELPPLHVSPQHLTCTCHHSTSRAARSVEGPTLPSSSRDTCRRLGPHLRGCYWQAGRGQGRRSPTHKEPRATRAWLQENQRDTDITGLVAHESKNQAAPGFPTSGLLLGPYP